MRTLGDVLEHRAQATPDALAYAENERRVTFGELAETATALAAGLARWGVRSGDRVALVLPAGIRFAERFWALQLLGAVPCAFHPDTKPDRLASRVESIRPSRVITPDLEIERTGGTVGSEAGPGSLAFLQRTSGTTGEPRAAMLTHHNVLAQLRSTEEGGHVGRDDVLVSWIPPWHDFGLVRFVIAPVYFGAPCHLVEPSLRTIPEWFETMTRVGCTHTGAPDFAFRLATRLVDPSMVDITSLRYIGCGGEPVRRSTVEQFEERFGLSRVMGPGYGLAEATLGVTARLGGEPLVVDERGNVCCGRAFPHCEVRVEGPPGTLGEILIRSDFVFAGYLDSPADTAAVLRDGWLHTGDLGYLDHEQRLFVLGRTKAMLKRAGGVVAPRELEELASTVRGVRQAAAFALPVASTVRSEGIVVAVEVDEPEARGEATTASVSEAIRDALGFSPDHVLVVPPRSIPMTANGKIRYDHLPALIA